MLLFSSSSDIFKGLLFMIKITFFMQIFLATTARKKEKIFFSLHFITHRIFISVGWLFLFRKLYCQRLNDESFGCIGERTSSMHFRDLLRKDSRSRSSSVYIRNTSSFLVDEKQTEKPNIYALALRKKMGKVLFN